VDPLVAQTNQAYAYVSDNPLNASDPSGLRGCFRCWWYDNFGGNKAAGDRACADCHHGGVNRVGGGGSCHSSACGGSMSMARPYNNVTRGQMSAKIWDDDGCTGTGGPRGRAERIKITIRPGWDDGPRLVITIHF